MFQKLQRNLQRSLFGKDPDYHDPYDDPGEQFYARIYLRYLFEKIEAEFRQQPVKVLDLGCHTGRLSVPLAAAGHEVTAIDSSRFHIRRAQAHARERGVNCRFLRGDGFKLIRRIPEGSFDLVVCTEVLYQIPDFRERMRELERLLRPGGLLATSHRTRFFYLSSAVRQKDIETARWILNHSEGKLWGSYFNWQAPGDLTQLVKELGMDVLLMRSVGTLTGNGGDGMAAFCDLTQMTEAEREALFEIEAHDSDEFAGIGRYLLVIGKKR